MTEPENSKATRSLSHLPGWLVSILRGAAISLGLGATFAWFGVYGTGEIPLPDRVAYWSGLMALGIACATVVNPLIFDHWMKDTHAALKIAAVSLIISIPITAGLVVLEAMSDGTVSQPSWWWTQYFYVVIVSALLTTGGWAVDLLINKPLDAQPAETAAATTAPADSAFADRLPARFRSADIHAVAAEDHYLRVHTSAGETMILMRLADAVRELATVEGMQTHRSWWVAKQGLVDTATGDGKVTLKLKSGAEAPVSRTYLKAVKDAGWL